MIKSTKFAATAVLTAVVMSTAALVVAPFNTNANAAAGQMQFDSASRIGAAFASIREIEPAPARKSAAMRAAKGDLYAPRNCEGAVWPNIDRACLHTVSGAPAPAVRTITIGYQEGEATTVLVRIPAAALAAQ